MGSNAGKDISEYRPHHSSSQIAFWEKQTEVSVTQPTVIVFALDADTLKKLLDSTPPTGKALYVVRDSEELKTILSTLQAGTSARQPSRTGQIKLGDKLWFDLEEGALVINGVPTLLSPSEAEVLNVLLQNQRNWIKASQIAEKVAFRLRRDDMSPHSVESIISALREMGLTITNRYGRGYKLIVSPELTKLFSGNEAAT